MSDTAGSFRLETLTTGVRISGALTAGGLTYPTTNGTSGDVLTSDGAGNVTWSTVSGGAGGANVTISDNPPANPTSGDLWWESDKGRLKILYSTVWVDANPVGGGGGGGSGSSYTNGDVDAHLNQTNPTSGYVLSWYGSDYAWVAQTGNTCLLYTSPSPRD